MSNLEIQVIDAQTEDNLTGIIIDGVPYLYWLRVYKALGITKAHAVEVIKRLSEGVHYRKFTKEEIQLLSGTVNVSLTVDPRARMFYFLTSEGYHRAIMEISTGHMNNPEVAAAIDAKKDHMASIYTRYQKGETLSLAADTAKAELPEEVQSGYVPVAVVLEDQLAIADLMIARNIEPAIAKRIAFTTTEEITKCGNAITPWKNLIYTDPSVQEPATLTPTDIGMELGGLSPRSINKILVKLDYQIKIGGEWSPTKSGLPYAKFVPQEIQHKSGVKRHMQLKWGPGIVDVIRKELNGEPDYRTRGQATLSQGVTA